MEFKHYEIIKSNGKAWYGINRIGYPAYIEEQIRLEKYNAHRNSIYSERECEVDCFLSVLENYSNNKLTMLDLGAGWGEWSLALHGVLQNKLIKSSLNNYYAVAVECDKEHYSNSIKNYELNGIIGNVVYGAIGNKNSKTRINSGKISSKYCGASLTYDGNFHDSKILALISGLYHRLSGQTDVVNEYTLKYIYYNKCFGDVNLLIMDIQGSESIVINNSIDIINKVDYLLIGTHGNKIHNLIKNTLSTSFNIIVDAQPNCATEIIENYIVLCRQGQDGILLCQKK